MDSNAPETASRVERAEELLRLAFAPEVLLVRDDSARHRGHAGWREGEQTHLVVHLVAETFRGETRLVRERRVHKVLAPLFAEGLHALTLKLEAPPE